MLDEQKLIITAGKLKKLLADAGEVAYNEGYQRGYSQIQKEIAEDVLDFENVNDLGYSVWVSLGLKNVRKQKITRK